MDENHLDDDNGMPVDETINISDVIEVIETDPDFKESTTMFNGGGEITQPSPSSSTNVQQSHRSVAHSRRRSAYVKIIEEPASKALRFRYECEGRSAGSIPGASSTPENKTFPAIQVCGYQGRAVVVVSCVTKDKPYRPHPHNLVGREGCKKGVCTLEIPPETMTITFSNLGIQCVKKKDIESALKVREEIKVDPYMTGFSHRNQPTSIDLNAVRLCFQVFLEGDTPGKFTVQLNPVVSQPIYDKKAMSDLIIVKLSDCVSYVDGGSKDIILLCEKVAKEDIQIRFYEEKDGKEVWEGYGEFQPSQVHKQTAIWFRTPRYHTLDITEPVRVFIQLKRPSDGACSEPLPFEFLPLDSGRPLYWSFRRNLTKKNNYDLFSNILAKDAKFLAQKQLGLTFLNTDKTTENLENNNNNPEENNRQIVVEQQPIEEKKNEEKSFNEIINQVAELDEIYSENQIKLLKNMSKDAEESFDDNRTYSSLQLAFKHPIEFAERDLELIKTQQIDLNQMNYNKREIDNEKPPLPPKRAKKIETFIGVETPTSSSSNPTIKIDDVNDKLINRSHSLNLLLRPKSQQSLDKLPPLPTKNSSSTLPNPKKKGFFSKLFGRKTKTPTISRESSATPTMSIRNQGNLSAASSTASIRIPLKDNNDDNKEENRIEIMDVDENNKNLDELTLNLDLTEAEHYALYTAMAPHATQSEFDEMSTYYAPVEETGKRKRQKFDDTTLLRRLEERIRTNPYLLNVPMEPIKVEPRDKTPSPFNYQGLSPNYSNVSPQYMPPTPTPPLDPTFTTPNNNNNNNNGNIPTTILPPIASVMQSPQQNWNIGGDSWNLPQQQQIQQNDLIMSGPSGLQHPQLQQQQQQNVEWNVLDLDTNQSELRVISLNSSELETHNLSESLTNINLSFSDINVQDQNMSDSLTRLAINAFEKIS